MAAEAVSGARRERARDVDWRGLAWGLLVAVAGTLVPGAALLAATRSVWAVAAAGVVSLLAGSWLAGRRFGRPELLVGATLGVLYFAAAAAVLLGGTLLEALPEPLPGLPVGDSTFFFVWPLTQLAAAVSGALLGGWHASRGRGGGGRPGDEGSVSGLEGEAR
ncbi:MAG: hypothetical protein HY332_01530 [Chloroflexi bacterium]|nr:hypothetical protein [Chloroflexota bacterium]